MPWRSGTPLYRLYNPGLANHLYTTDTKEVKVLARKYGWEKDNDGKTIFSSGGGVDAYCIYYEGLNGM